MNIKYKFRINTACEAVTRCKTINYIFNNYYLYLYLRDFRTILTCDSSIKSDYIIVLISLREFPAKIFQYYTTILKKY